MLLFVRCAQFGGGFLVLLAEILQFCLLSLLSQLFLFLLHIPSYSFVRLKELKILRRANLLGFILVNHKYIFLSHRKKPHKLGVFDFLRDFFVRAFFLVFIGRIELRPLDNRHSSCQDLLFWQHFRGLMLTYLSNRLW